MTATTAHQDMLLDLIEQAMSPEPAAPAVPEEPEYLKGIHRGLVAVPAPEIAQHEKISIGQARERIRAALDQYLALQTPGHALLIKALPGVGKTTAAVEAAELLAMKGKRVLYAGPRHDFFGDLMEIADHPGWWYEWLPRQKGNEAKGKPETCPYADEITTWMARGYPGIEFCKRICGWDWIKSGCAYHEQKQRTEPIIFGQHQHVILGHPLQFHVCLGDEYPVPAFCWMWRIPEKWLLPKSMSPLSAVGMLVRSLTKLASEDLRLEGEALITCLGGPQQVLRALEQWTMPATGKPIVPEISDPKEVAEVDYAYVQHLVPLLAREARCMADGLEYPHRLVIANGALLLLLRRPVNEEMPRHLVWLDATANSRLYEACFQRKCETVDAAPELRGHIYQIYDRANGKASVLDKEGTSTSKADQLEEQVQRIMVVGGYAAPAIISYQKLVEQTTTFRDLEHTHFYAARGTNALEHCDALIVAGTPQPPLRNLHTLARMIFFERMTPFTNDWSTAPRPYNYLAPDGEGRAYPTSGFWGDPDLQAVLWSLREAEVIQAAHRVRPVNQEVDIWLLLNLPVAELPPKRLLSIRELFGAPEGVNVYQWPEVLELAEHLDDERGVVTSADLVAALGIDAHTARKYIQILIDEHGWQPVKAATRRRGRPAVGASRE